MAARGSGLEGKLLEYGIIAVVAYYGVLKPILQKVNVIDTPEEKKAAEALKKYDFGSDPVSNPFNPVFAAKAPAGSLLISTATGKDYSKIIFDAHGYFNDDEDSIYGVFNKLKTQSQVSSLAYFFNLNYSKDLFSYLKSFLDSDEMQTIATIVGGKPKYKI